MKSIIKVFVFSIMCIMSGAALAQETTTVEGYVYESGNRGYLNVVQVTAINKSTSAQIAQVYTNEDGFFTFEARAGEALEVKVIKDMFQPKSMDLNPAVDQKNFLQFELKREPGYIFEITMAEKRDDSETPVDAIRGTRVEVYNNTTQKEVLALNDYEHPEFRVNLEKGNHYTILIRKKGYLAKRMEAFVNVKGCILCFEGIGSVRPGVSETMTEGNENGLLLANVELEKIFTGKKMEIENIYYDLAKWDIKPQAEKQLNTIIQLMKDNPRLTIELGSHTDSRGKDDYNMELSQKRAKSAVDYLKNTGNVKDGSITYRGYGETQIANKCKNGVYCSEKEHAANRRTELKITGMFAESREKSLFQMKTEARLEQEILSGEADEQQIEVLPGETIDDALARIKLEKEEKQKLLGRGVIIDSEDIENAPEVSDGNYEEDANDVIVKHMDAHGTHDVHDGHDHAHDHEAEGKAAVQEVMKTDVEVTSKTTVEEVIKTDIVEDSNIDVTAPSQSPSKGLGGFKVDVPQLSEDADGIFISLHNGVDRLPLTHKIYKTFPDLNWYPSSDGKIYYVVDRVYPTIEKAQSYIDQHIIADYPDARVLRFIKGVRQK